MLTRDYCWDNDGVWDFTNMIAITTEIRTEDVARGLFELTTRVSLTTLPGRRRAGDLKELEYLTLAVLHERGMQNVGEIQRILGVLPAQMSRIIRSLEHQERPLITCGINPRDKRKIDVTITPHGQKALQDHQVGRVHRITQLLRELPEDAREELLHSLERVADLLERPGRL